MIFYDVSDSGGDSTVSDDSAASDSNNAQLTNLSDFLWARRAEILRDWREAMAQDEALTTGRQLTRIQLLDHVPQLLEQLTKSLRSNAASSALLPPAERDTVSASGEQAAREHGIHRWQQGYSVLEVTREFGHLHLCIADEFELYSQSYPRFSATSMHQAHRQLALLVNAGVEQSVEQFTRGREAEARTQMRNLEQVLSEFGKTERARGHSLRAASHDLRGSLAVVEGTASLLRQTEEEALRNDLTELMQRGVDSLKRMMNDLLDLARLEAGEENLRTASFDVAALLHGLCEASQPLAHNYGLTLEASGPPLSVEGDAIKTQRIVQNLLLNALKYTQDGGVRIEWQVVNDAEWMLRVLDTGGGLDSQQSAPLVAQVKAAIEINRDAEPEAETKSDASSTGNDAKSLCDALSDLQETAATTTQTEQQADLQERLHPGEGIGLTIVKRLCDLLDARLEVESNQNGSAFCVIFPRHYDGRHS